MYIGREQICIAVRFDRVPQHNHACRPLAVALRKRIHHAVKFVWLLKRRINEDDTPALCGRKPGFHGSPAVHSACGGASVVGESALHHAGVIGMEFRQRQPVGAAQQMRCEHG